MNDFVLYELLKPISEWCAAENIRRAATNKIAPSTTGAAEGVKPMATHQGQGSEGAPPIDLPAPSATSTRDAVGWCDGCDATFIGNKPPAGWLWVYKMGLDLCPACSIDYEESHRPPDVPAYGSADAASVEEPASVDHPADAGTDRPVEPCPAPGATARPAGFPVQSVVPPEEVGS